MVAASLIAAAVLLLAPPGASASAPGALKLDNYTFDKMLAIPDISLLVKIDKSYAWGEKEDEFKALCKNAYATPKFFIAEVPVQEYNEKENDDLRERFKLAVGDFPAYFLFTPTNKEGIRYEGEVKADLLHLWLRRNKVRLPAVGTIEELDEIAKKFLASGMSDTHMKEAEKVAASEQYASDPKASLYSKIMGKIKEKGKEYIGAESARVAKILEGQVTSEKRTELSDKLKVLGIFDAARDEL